MAYEKPTFFSWQSKGGQQEGSVGQSTHYKGQPDDPRSVSETHDGKRLTAESYCLLSIHTHVPECAHT